MDTETTGLRPYHGDRPFSVIIGTTQAAWYFNFNKTPEFDEDEVLTPGHFKRLANLFSDPEKTWDLFNANFDQHMLAQHGLFLAGTIHDAKVAALLVYNEHNSYSLANCAAREGLQKDDAVEKYIEEHKLKEKRQGATQAYTHKFYDRVPRHLIVPYGIKDALVTGHLAQLQEQELLRQARQTPEGLPTVLNVLNNERRLTQTVFRMEHVGVKIDRAYCTEAMAYERDRQAKGLEEFKRLTGTDYVASEKCLSPVFESEKDKWEYTDKGNPSFNSEVLATFENPAARVVLQIRDAKSKADFYGGFLYHADENDIVHPNFNQDGAGHGRFSSSNPNFQNLTSEDILTCRACKKGHEEVVTECEKCGSTDLVEPPFLVRRAIIPRPGYIFLMPDYSQMEYRMMFDLACRRLGYASEIVKKILQGHDPHQATADTVTEMGTPLTRGRAKNGNFAILYGSGVATLAKTIGGTVAEARALRSAMKQASPEVDKLVRGVMETAERRGFIFNWFGRRCYFPDPRFAYRAPNYLIAGGCADVNKIALNRIDEYLLAMKSRLVLTIHDENPVECHESEVDVVPKQVQELMEGVYPHKYLPLTSSMEWSEKSLADKKKGFPV